MAPLFPRGLLHLCFRERKDTPYDRQLAWCYQNRWERLGKGASCTVHVAANKHLVYLPQQVGTTETCDETTSDGFGDGQQRKTVWGYQSAWPVATGRMNVKPLRSLCTDHSCGFETFGVMRSYC